MDVEEIKKQFGVRLHELRRRRGLSQEQLASLAGMDRTYVSSCERGARNISLVNIGKLATALGVEPCELLRTTEES
ncbi:MAG: transcriptional regulator [Actinobacteria bacterium HGW-Actinobacteria-7]|jgi:transcriptional regulator with XRE-family HTH domain|nr:MAG: transcriptional regulator [Actinobacteria bacterium HGW-Actinobacteria-7]